jgi:membrane fusion protein (multidrug efflux system)
MMKVHPFSAFLGLATLVMLVSCGEENAETETSETATEKITTVKVVHPKENSFVAEISIVGTVIPNRKVMLHAMENGMVSKMLVDIGAKVSKGETIAELANPELVRAREQAVAKMEVAKSIFDRLSQIRADSPALTTLQQIETAEADFKMAEAELNGIDDRIGFLKVTAPFSGIVSQRFVDEGALVQNGIKDNDAKPLVEIQDLSVVRITVPVPESDVTKISIGQTAKINFRELGNKTFDAKVSRTSLALDPASKTMEVQIDIQNSNGSIRPGMYARILFEIGSTDGVLSLPLTSIIVSSNKYYVSVVKDDIVERVSIERGLANKDFYEVLSELDKDALVIVEGKNLVKPGQKVETVLGE